MKQPSLTYEDGAELFCEIQRIEGAGFRASCYARSRTQSEDHEFHVSSSEEEAKSWIASHANGRGLPVYWLKVGAPGHR
jgi:hypothetical protein